MRTSFWHHASFIYVWSSGFYRHLVKSHELETKRDTPGVNQIVCRLCSWSSCRRRSNDSATWRKCNLANFAVQIPADLESGWCLDMTVYRIPKYSMPKCSSQYIFISRTDLGPMYAMLMNVRSNQFQSRFVNVSDWKGIWFEHGMAIWPLLTCKFLWWGTQLRNLLRKEMLQWKHDVGNKGSNGIWASCFTCVQLPFKECSVGSTSSWGRAL